jgi:hypothetical protein
MIEMDPMPNGGDDAAIDCSLKHKPAHRMRLHLVG